MGLRVWRSLSRQDKASHRIAKAMVVTEEEYVENMENIESLTKIIRLK